MASSCRRNLRGVGWCGAASRGRDPILRARYTTRRAVGKWRVQRRCCKAVPVQITIFPHPLLNRSDGKLDAQALKLVQA